MQIQIMFRLLVVCLLCEMSWENVSFSDEKREGSEKSETKDYIEVKEYIEALRKLLLEIEKTRNKAQKCKLVVQQLKINDKTDLKITYSLLTKFKKIWISHKDAYPDEVALMLSCLEHFMNNFNNAQAFDDIHGIEDIIFPTLESTFSIIKAEAAHLLATAALNSPKVQISAQRTGIIGFLLKCVVLESDVTVRINSMRAVACLLKDYPEAQAKFVDVGGLSTLAQVVEKSHENHLVLIEIIAMIHDLVNEHKKALKSFTKQELTTDLYQAISFENTIVNEGWCLRIAQLLMAPEHSRQEGVTPSTQRKVRTELDLVEKICETLLALVDTCRQEFVHIQLKKVSNDLKNAFMTKERLVNGTAKAKYSHITHVFGQLTSDIDKFITKDEL